MIQKKIAASIAKQCQMTLPLPSFVRVFIDEGVRRKCEEIDYFPIRTCSASSQSMFILHLHRRLTC